MRTIPIIAFRVNERERDRQRGEWEREREWDRQRDTEREKLKDRQTEGEREKETDIEWDKQTGRWVECEREWVENVIHIINKYSNKKVSRDKCQSVRTLINLKNKNNLNN